MRTLSLVLFLLAFVGCEWPTAVAVRGPCKVRVVNYWNVNGQLDSTVTVVDTVACPR